MLRFPAALLRFLAAQGAMPEQWVMLLVGVRVGAAGTKAQPREYLPADLVVHVLAVAAEAKWCPRPGLGPSWARSAGAR